jgi:hypothetical protein
MVQQIHRAGNKRITIAVATIVVVRKAAVATINRLVVIRISVAAVSANIFPFRIPQKF